MITQIIFYLSLGILGGIAFFLCLWCRYNDGIIGKVALGAVAMGAVIIIIEALFGYKHYIEEPEQVLLLGGLAVFWLRHVTRRLNRFRKQLPARRAGDME